MVGISKLIARILLAFTLFCACKGKQQPIAQLSAGAGRIIDESNVLLKRGEFEKALAHLDSGYAAISSPNRRDLWEKYSFLANFYQHYRPDTIRTRIYTDSMSMAILGHEDEYARQFVATKLSKGNMLISRRLSNLAFKEYFEARLYARENLELCELSACSYQLGMLLYHQQRFENAAPYFKEAFRSSLQCSGAASEYQQVMVPQQSLNAIGLCYTKVGKADSALVYYNRALVFLNSREENFPGEKDNILAAKGVIYGNMTGVFELKGDLKKATAFAKKSILINDRDGFERADAQTARLKLAGIYIKLRLFDEAAYQLDRVDGYFLRSRSMAEVDHKIATDQADMRARLYEKRGETALAYQSLKRYNALKIQQETSRQALQQADLETAFINIDQEHRFSLLKEKNRNQKLLIWSSALGLFSLTVIAFLLRQRQRRSAMVNANLLETLALLEESQAMNKRVLKVVAHDLRNPVGSILALSEILLRSQYMEGKELKAVELIRKSAENSLQLLENLLEERIKETHGLVEEIDLQKLLGYCVGIAKAKATQKKQVIKASFDPVTLTSDRQQLWRAISNLLINAIRFSPEGASIRIRLKRKGNKALITIASKGLEIPADIPPASLDLPSTHTAGDISFGLGLDITRRIIEALNGNLRFERDRTDGTVFFIELPFASFVNTVGKCKPGG